MQNQNQDKPNYDQYSQEIDLVDVAAVVYRRKLTLLLVVLFSVIVAIGYWFSIQGKQQVSAVFKIGEEMLLGPGSKMVPLMTAEDSEQLLNLVYLPILIKSIKLETGMQIDNEGIDINYAGSEKDSEENSSILELFAEVPKKKVQTIITIFNDSLELLLKNHDEKLNEYRSKINYQIEIARSRLLISSKFSTPDNPLEGIDRYTVELSIITLESFLAASTNSTIEKRASIEPVESKGPAIYVVGGFVFGLFFGCFVVFFLELYTKAKIRAAEIT